MKNEKKTPNLNRNWIL